MSLQSVCASMEVDGAHEVKVAIRWDERDSPVVLKSRQPHTLVKLDVLQIHRLVLRAPPWLSKSTCARQEGVTALDLQHGGVLGQGL